MKQQIFFSRKMQKRLQEGQFYFVQYIKDFFGHFTTTPDYSRRFPNPTEDSWRLSKISEDWPEGPTLAEDVRRTLQTLNSVFFGNSKH